MELSSDKTQLLKDTNDKQQKRNTFLYIIIVLFGVTILTLLIINLWQAGIFETDSESENVFIEECSGNGHSYNDLNKCECFQCYAGENCEIEEEDCMISAGSGTPFLLMEYWTEQRRNGKIKPLLTEIDYRMPYDSVSRGPHSQDSAAGLGGELNQIIRRIHAKYNNVNMTDTHLVFGLGATQLNTAGFVAFSDSIGGQQIIAFDAVPYYFGYPRCCSAAGPSRCVWNESSELLDEGNIVEYVVIPDNPTGQFRERVYQNSSMYAHDLVYYWPSYVHEDDHLNPLNAPISFFSASKLTGHASTRFGWAFVKNETLARHMTTYISSVEGRFPVDTAHRAYQFLSHIEEYGDDFFEFARQRMKERFEILSDILSGQNNYVSRGSFGAFFAWIECVNKTETQVMDVFASYNMRPIGGSSFGAPVSPNSFVRIGMNQFEGNFVKMMQGMSLLVDEER